MRIFINPMCKKCCDTGKVGFFNNKTCPVCNGDPIALFKSTKPPPPPPQNSRKSVEIKITF